MSQIKGLNNLLKKLDSLGGNIEEVMYNAIDTQARFVQGEAKDSCPTDTGDLQKLIYQETEYSGDTIRGVVGTNLGHAAYVEFGTGKKGEETNTYPGISFKQDKWKVNIPDVGVRWIEGQPAQPFLYPALKNNKDKIIDGIKKDVQKSIDKISK